MGDPAKCRVSQSECETERDRHAPGADGWPGRADEAADREPGKAASEVRSTANGKGCGAASGEDRGPAYGKICRPASG